MNRIVIFLNLFLLALALGAQVPEGFNYQAVVRNNSGEVIANSAVKFRMSILLNSETGTVVYSETHSVTTNDFGLVNLVVGKGTKTGGSFNSSDWGANAHFLKVEVDPAGGNSFTYLGTTQLLSVPYAFHAQTVEEEEDGDPVNELQSLSISGTNLTLSQGGGTVPLPTSGGGDNWGSDYVHTDATLAGQGTTSTPLKIAQQSATTGQVLKWNGTTWLPGVDLSGSSLWSQNGSNIFYNTGKVGVGIDPGSSLRQFQVIGGTNIAIAGTNSSASYPAIYAENSTDGGLAARFVNKSGPVVRFERNLVIADGTQGSGKVLTSDANGTTSWQTPSTNPWLTSGSNIYYNSGWVGIGTSSISHPLSIENANNTCYIKLKDNQGTGGMRIGAYIGELAFINDNANKNIRFATYTGSAYKQILTLNASTQSVGINTDAPPYDLSVMGSGSPGEISIHTSVTGISATDGLRIGMSNTLNAWVWNNEFGDLYFGTNNLERVRINRDGKVGIGDYTPEATLDVEGTVVIGSGGKLFSEIREITGTTTTGGSKTISYPSGYNMSNIRVLSLEINYNGSSWIGLGGNQQNTSINERIFYYLGANIMIYHPPVAEFQNRAFRMMVMKVQ